MDRLFRGLGLAGLLFGLVRSGLAVANSGPIALIAFILLAQSTTSSPQGRLEYSDRCSRALSSPSIKDMDELVEEIGINYQRTFDATLVGQCGRAELIAFLKKQRGFRFEESRAYAGETIDYFRDNPRPFPMRSPRLWFQCANNFGTTWRISAIELVNICDIEERSDGSDPY